MSIIHDPLIWWIKVSLSHIDGECFTPQWFSSLVATLFGGVISYIVCCVINISVCRTHKHVRSWLNFLLTWIPSKFKMTLTYYTMSFSFVTSSTQLWRTSLIWLLYKFMERHEWARTTNCRAQVALPRNKKFWFECDTPL